MKNRIFWQLMMAGSVIGWLFIVFGIIFPFEGGWMRIAWWCVLLGWGVLHPLELVFSLPAAKTRGLALERAFAKTMLFGFTWWVPLKMGVFDD
jgi:hypothetical protein